MDLSIVANLTDRLGSLPWSGRSSPPDIMVSSSSASSSGSGSADGPAAASAAAAAASSLLNRRSSTPLLLLLLLLAAYATLCRTLRFRRQRALRREMGFPPETSGDREKEKAALAGMSNDQAQRIIRCIAAYEMPAFHLLALQFGLFKTYGVESISKLLLGTGNLTAKDSRSLKRYEDTAALIGEFMINPPTSERALRGIARMNFLHQKYVDAGQISNEDLLYVLSVFVTEPIRFARLYEWRELNEMEVCAYGVFWKALGDAMGIRYGGSGLLARAGAWRDGTEFAADITAWAKEYEVRKMRPSRISHRPARALIPMITYWAPRWAKPLAEEVVCVLMGDRVREAFMLPEPGIGAAALVFPALWVRRFVLRHLALPRLGELRRLGDEDGAEADGEKVSGGDRHYHTRHAYGNFPYYVRPTLWNRWGPRAWAVWLLGGSLPGDDPAEHMPQGYRFADLGPRDRMGQGLDEMDEDVGRMAASGRGGCPF
ncbi:hypothetical protein GGR56DRAFT_675860 [Xylariaceae sp. FL0804]|nr:hypothetical protein GGR56DRAFT_675860 [Xylariaceae sp. FL0804]